MSRKICYFLMLTMFLASSVFGQQIGIPTSVEISLSSEIKKPHVFDVKWKAPVGVDVKGYYYKLDQEAKTRWTSKPFVNGLRVVSGGKHQLYIATCDKNDVISPFLVIPFNCILPFPNGGKIDLTEPLVYEAGGSPGITSIGDVNNDGLNDVVCANYYDNTISVFIQGKDGKLATQTTYPTAQGSFGVGIGDIDRDGLNEVIVGCAASDVIYIFSQTPGGTLTLTSTYQTGRGPYGLDIGDINGDGRNDILVPNSGGLSMSVYTWLPDNPRGYQTLMESFSNCLSLTMQKIEGGLFAHLLYPSGATSYWVAVGDMNADGLQDVACVNYSDNSVSLYFQQPNFALKPVGALTTVGGNPPIVCIGDINNDGINEAIASSDPVSIFGKKDNSFGLIGTQTTNDGKTGGIKCGDLNNDGLNDLICTQAKNVSIFLQNTNNKLSSPSSYYAGDVPGGLSVGDVNDDGLNDVITGNIRGNSVSVLYPVWKK